MRHTDHSFSPMKVNIPWHPDKSVLDYNKIFFGHFFPSLKGKAKLMDEYLRDDRCSMLRVIKKDGVKFHRPNNPDPDFLVKVCVMLVISAALEVHNGIENLWKRGLSYGLKDYPNFSQYIPCSYFQAFVCAFPFVWGDKKYWHAPKQDLPWDCFLPFVADYNAVRAKLTNVMYLVLDESMCGWRPKTTATGGLPNITFEPRKPKNLGTMVKNGAECISGIMTHHDIVQAHGDLQM